MKRPGIFPFEKPFSVIEANIEAYVETVINSLESSFLTMPKGKGFVEYGVFEQGYEGLKRATNGFTNVTCEAIKSAVQEHAISFIVLRAILGFTPPEWAYVASQNSGQNITQGYARGIDRKIRLAQRNL